MVNLWGTKTSLFWPTKSAPIMTNMLQLWPSPISGGELDHAEGTSPKSPLEGGGVTIQSSAFVPFLFEDLERSNVLIGALWVSPNSKNRIFQMFTYWRIQEGPEFEMELKKSEFAIGRVEVFRSLQLTYHSMLTLLNSSTFLIGQSITNSVKIEIDFVNSFHFRRPTRCTLKLYVGKYN